MTYNRFTLEMVISNARKEMTAKGYRVNLDGLKLFEALQMVAGNAVPTQEQYKVACEMVAHDIMTNSIKVA